MERIFPKKLRPESDRLGVLRVSRQVNHEAMCFLYQHKTFCFSVQDLSKVSTMPLGPEAISMIQYVDIRVDTTISLDSYRGPERRKCFVSHLRGLGDSKIPRKRCHVTLEHLVDPGLVSPNRFIPELNTLSNFELLILNASFDRKSSIFGYIFVRPYFDTYIKELEFDLRPGVYETYDGHCCVIFRPIRTSHQEESHDASQAQESSG